MIDAEVMIKNTYYTHYYVRYKVQILVLHETLNITTKLTQTIFICTARCLSVFLLVFSSFHICVLPCKEAQLIKMGSSRLPPGLVWFIPWLDAIQTVDLRTMFFNIWPQEVSSIL